MTTVQTINRQTMQLYLLLLFCTLTILTSCNGQNTSISNSRNSTITLGDTVSELSKSIWIVFQATNGDYWFGSDTSGVYRFDGKTIINFSTSDGLSSNRIIASGAFRKINREILKFPPNKHDHYHC